MSRGTTTAPARRAASSGTAERFAARVRSRRRRRLATLVAALAVLAALVWLVLFSPYLVLEQVEVRGLDRVPPDRVRAIVEVERGRPMVLVDPTRVAHRVAEIRLVRAVDVQRDWPATMTVVVTERQPVAAVPASGAGYRLVDRDGVEVETVSDRPDALPFLEVAVDGRPASVAALDAALEVLESLPEPIRARVAGIGASSADGVWFTLAPEPVDGGEEQGAGSRSGTSRTSKVVWGSADAPQEKTDVLQVLLAASGSTPAARYDVSSPTAPAVDPR